MKPVLICTPTWNKAEFLARTLQSLALDCDPELYHHVIIDNSSADDTAQVCQSFGVERIYNPNNVGIAAALNQAVVMLRPSQYFMKLDDDITPLGAGWMEAMLKAMKADRIGGVALSRLGRDDEQLANDTVTSNGEWLVPSGEQWWTNCALYRYEAVQDLGSFWQPTRYGFEDILTGARLRKLGWKTVYLPAYRIVHEGCWSRRRENKEYIAWKAQERRAAGKIDKILAEIESGKRPAYIPLNVA